MAIGGRLPTIDITSNEFIEVNSKHVINWFLYDLNNRKADVGSYQGVSLFYQKITEKNRNSYFSSIHLMKWR